MRNLKKILALALALVMTLSLMTVANAFSDDADISAGYAESVAVLSGMGVFEGYTDGSFKPEGSITRAEVAAIVYRLATGDVDDKNVAIHKDHAQFKDVTADHWAAGYIGYCANAQLIKGYGDGNFGPSDKVTGYAALAMILRAVGYDQHGEFTGEGWEVEVAEVATDLGLLKTIKESLGVAATREMVAEILFQTAAKAYIVKWTNAFGYQPVSLAASTVSSGVVYTTLGVRNFNLAPATKTDEWGRPSYGYTYTTGNKATWFAIPAINKYNVATPECTIATDLKLDGNKEVPVDTYVNGVDNKTTTNINAVDTVNKVGAQGRQVEVYPDRLVIIDTFLANVDAVAPATYDAAGHLKTEATLYLTVYDRAAGIKVKVTAGKADYAYTAGQKLLVNMKTYTASVDTVDLKVAADATGYAVPKLLQVAGVANSIVGAQTVIWQNAPKHTVAGTTYDDACQYHKDAAANNGVAQFTWFFDQFGNLIGSFDIQTTYTYATIANIQWMNPAAVNGYAQATLVYTDGKTESVVVRGIDKNADWDIADTGEVLSYTFFTGVYADGSVSMNYGYNGEYIGEKLFAVAKDANGIVTLSEIKTVLDLADVTKGNPVVAAGVYIDDATQFLVRTGNGTVGYTYTPVTGYNQITSLKDAYVAYVNLDADAPAEIVYMYGSNVTSPIANLVFIANDAYNWVAGTNDFITLLGAEIQGANSPVVINKERLDGTAPDCVVGNLYHMVDKNGDGKVDVKNGDICNEITTAEYDLGNGVKAKKILAGGYSLVANAIEVTGEVVPYNNTTATVYGGTLTGAENIVLVYTGYNVSAIYIVK